MKAEDLETIKAIASDSKVRVDRIINNYELLLEENEELKKENAELKKDRDRWKQRAIDTYGEC